MVIINGLKARNKLIINLNPPLLTASKLSTAVCAVSPIRTMRHAAIIPALPFPALQCKETTLSSCASSQAFAFSQKSTTDSRGGQVSSVKGYLWR